jgi:hypothetical protein
MSKLTLSVEKDIISRAKRYAREQGVSVSEMVETYLAAVAEAPTRSTKDAPPILRSIRGSLKKADLQEYKKYRSAKYR